MCSIQLTSKSEETQIKIYLFRVQNVYRQAQINCLACKLIRILFLTEPILIDFLLLLSRFMPIHLSLEIFNSSCQRRLHQEAKNQWDNKVSRTSLHQEAEAALVETEEVASEVEVEAEEETEAEASEAVVIEEDSEVVVEEETEAEASEAEVAVVVDLMVVVPMEVAEVDENPILYFN